MNFLKRVVVLFQVVLIMFISTTILLYVLNQIDLNDTFNTLWIIYHDDTLKLIFGGLGLAMLSINFIFYKIFSVNVRRDKIIAFDNPSGRVSVSLVAMEDLVKRMLVRSTEVRDVKPMITAAKKGIQVKIQLVLRSEVNIPEVSSKIQTSVTKKIQDIIGLDESVEVSVYVGKILPDQTKTKQKEEKSEPDDDNPEPNIPFQGYRA